MADRAFFEENTMLTMYVIAGAISALANNESIAKISAANTPDGDVQLGIKDKAAVTISCKGSPLYQRLKSLAITRAP